ncbi:MAG: TetR/AcrR family transcriptional regulator [Polyangiaceae bacterium]|nr:TetR/AcrR family transcriptional regulator [Polyangiaceae bacterium]
MVKPQNAVRRAAVAPPKATPRRSPRSRDPERTRELLLAAAARAFDRDGYFGTDTNRIAREAGFAPATLYRYFEDKRALFLATYERWVEAEWSDLFSRLDAQTPKLKGTARKRALAQAVVDHHKRWAGLRASLLGLVASDPQVAAFRVASRARQLDWLTPLLGADERPRALLILLAFERVADSIALGEASALGISEDLLLEQLCTLI